ncbi:hypothetical protein V1520DRAFT_20774 [Lipomyces starkeyi]|uniref:Actin cytoskeleton-regulatory complex protein PAN1 n=1 Tax=Lipomyces starkeyi NRRL Y-11557 TaxID=675824 RepID=A0A1E3Q2H1_LIPST|nr:hypothetical protein LIPSTDRAFT_4271 [Lipomyces starkeyi NRRL Y-11557]
MFNPSQFQGMQVAPGVPGMPLIPNNTGMDFGLPGIQALQARMMPQIGAQPGAPNIGPGGSTLTGNNKISWAITKAEKKIFDDIFDAWDGLGRGFISGETAVEILGQSGLPRDDLEKIWTLSDPEDRGRLNKSEFSVAMHLVYRRLNSYPIPTHLPPELIPPSTRNLSQSVSTLKNMLKSDADQRRSNMLLPQATGVSYLKARSFREPVNETPKKDATVFKNNDDEAALYVSSARRRNGGSRGATGSPSPTVSSAGSSGKELSKGETLESLRKAIREKKILLNAIDSEDDFAFNEDQYLNSRDRDESDDLIRKIRHIQEDINDYTSSVPSTNLNAEKAALRNRLQYLTDRLPVLVGRARSIGNKISDAKLELFRIRDVKAHPGAQVIGTGPGGRVTEADKRKARSLAILQTRMAALTGKAAPADDGSDAQHSSELRLAEETDKMRAEKEKNEQMIRDVEESVRAVQDSLEGLLKETRQDFKVERERQLFEEGVGAEDEVRELILELQRRHARSELRASTTSTSNYSEPSHGHQSFQNESTFSNGSPVPVSASPARLASTSTGPSTASSKPGSGSFYAQFRTPEERAAWIKSEAERRMNERLAALGISRPAKSANSSSAFSAPPPVVVSPEPQSDAFTPPAPSSQPSYESAPTPPHPAPKTAGPESTSSSIFSQPVAQSQTHYQPPVPAPSSRNPFPVQGDFYYDSSKPTASRYAEVDFNRPESPQRLSTNVPTGGPVATPLSLTISEPPTPDFYTEVQIKSSRSPTPASPPPAIKSPGPLAPPSVRRVPSPVQVTQLHIQVPTPSVPSSSSTPSATAVPNQAALDAQRRYQRGHGDDEDDWSVVPSESESSDDEGPSPVAGAGPKKPSPADLASLLFGSMAPQTQHVASNNQSSAATSTSRGTPYETAATSPAPPAQGIPPPPPIPDGFGGAAPPAPPPPPPIFGAPMPHITPAPIAPPTSAGAPGGGLADRSLLLGQITAGRQLKKVQTMDKSQSATVGRVL